MNWIAIVEIILKVIAECREDRNRADVTEDVRKRGPLARIIVRRAVRCRDARPSGDPGQAGIATVRSPGRAGKPRCVVLGRPMTF